MWHRPKVRHGHHNTMITAIVGAALMGLLTWAGVYITKAEIEEANKKDKS